jgi:hypothetical protein
MGAPDLAVAVEPTISGSAVFMPLAAKTTADQPAGLLCLRLFVTNKSTASVHLNTVTLSFTPPVIGPIADTTSIDIPAGQTMEWNFSTVQDVFLPATPPTQLTLALSCDNFSSPFQTDLPLAPYAAPEGAIAFRQIRRRWRTANSGTGQAATTAPARGAASSSPTTSA